MADDPKNQRTPSKRSLEALEGEVETLKSEVTALQNNLGGRIKGLEEQGSHAQSQGAKPQAAAAALPPGAIVVVFFNPATGEQVRLPKDTEVKVSGLSQNGTKECVTEKLKVGPHDSAYFETQEIRKKLQITDRERWTELTLDMDSVDGPNCSRISAVGTQFRVDPKAGHCNRILVPILEERGSTGFAVVVFDADGGNASAKSPILSKKSVKITVTPVAQVGTNGGVMPPVTSASTTHETKNGSVEITGLPQRHLYQVTATAPDGYFCDQPMQQQYVCCENWTEMQFTLHACPAGAKCNLMLVRDDCSATPLGGLTVHVDGVPYCSQADGLLPISINETKRVPLEVAGKTLTPAVANLVEGENSLLLIKVSDKPSASTVRQPHAIGSTSDFQLFLPEVPTNAVVTVDVLNPDGSFEKTVNVGSSRHVTIPGKPGDTRRFALRVDGREVETITLTA
jgi:hypothetical protein